MAGMAPSTPQTSRPNWTKRSGFVSWQYRAQLPHTADRLAPWATPYLPLSTWPSWWGAKSFGAPKPVRPLWDRDPAHISSLMACASPGFSKARLPLRTTVRSRPWAISSVSSLPVGLLKYRSMVCIMISTVPQAT